jgi:hypothetical protein
MKLHKYGRLSPRGRALLVDRHPRSGPASGGGRPCAGVSVRTDYKWLKPFKEEGTAGPADRPPDLSGARMQHLRPLWIGYLSNVVHGEPTARLPSNYPWPRALSPGCCTVPAWIGRAGTGSAGEPL